MSADVHRVSGDAGGGPRGCVFVESKSWPEANTFSLYSGEMSFDYKTPSDHANVEARQQQAEELVRILPSLSSDEIADGVNRRCLMLGSGTSMDEVDRGTFAAFRAGKGRGFDNDSALV
jgi:hypothetical protein